MPPYLMEAVVVRVICLTSPSLLGGHAVTGTGQPGSEQQGQVDRVISRAPGQGTWTGHLGSYIDTWTVRLTPASASEKKR